jgi:site-specific DNA recombinase
MLKLTLVFAELERERTSERTREKIQMRRHAGMWFGGIPPLGYKSHPTDKTTLLIDDAAKDLAREIFARYLELGSARALTRELGQRGIRRPALNTSRGKKWGGGVFTTQSLVQILSNTVYIAKRDRGDGKLVECNWAMLIDPETFEGVQKRLVKNREKRPSGKALTGHNFLLEGLLRCGACGSTMVRTTGTGKSGKLYFYYRCAKKHKTAYQGCKVADVPAPAVERFVLDQLSSYVIDPAALKASVSEGNAGRDAELLAVEAQVRETDNACLQKGKQISKLLDAIETGEGDDLAAVRARLRERETELQEIRERKAELVGKRDLIRREVLEADTVVDAYRKVPYLLTEAQRVGAHDELRALVQAIVEVVEWRQNPERPKEGEALIELFPLPDLLARPVADPATGSVNRSVGGSSCRQDWLRRRVSNPRPGG